MERLVSILISGIFALTIYVWLLKALAKKNVVKYIRAPARWWLHPNAICVWRGLTAWLGLWLYFFTDYYFIGIFLFTNSAVADAYDGEIARSCNLQTELGAAWDPIWDKYTYIPAMLFFALGSDLLLVEEVAIFGLIDFIWVQLVSRKLVNRLKKEERYAKLSISANNFGKIKTVLCFSLIIYCSLLEDGLFIPNFSRELLYMCIILSLASGAFKLIPNRLYADILSLLNLGCGIVGIVFIGQGQYVLNVLCVLAGQILDVLDGRMAHKHGGTKLGPKLDDIADMVSFGFNPAILIMKVGNFEPLFVMLGLVYALLVGYRLRRFLIYDRHNPLLPSGVFNGLPSPAGAMAVMGACLCWPGSFEMFPAVGLIGVLMCGHWQFVHFGRVIAPRLKKIGVIIIFSLLAGATAYLVRAGDTALFGEALLAVTAIYILAGNNKFFRKKISP